MTLDILLAEIDHDLEGVVADVEHVRVSAFRLSLIHARLAVGCTRISQHARLVAARRMPTNRLVARHAAEQLWNGEHVVE